MFLSYNKDIVSWEASNRIYLGSKYDIFRGAKGIETGLPCYILYLVADTQQ
jgi:hypothetical protein